MSEELQNLHSEQKIVEDKLAKLPKEKWKIYRLFIAAPICIFLGPYIPMRRGTLESRMGYHDSVLMFIVLWMIVIPIAIYMHYNKVNDQIFEAEMELDEIKRKIDELQNRHSL